MPSSCTWKVRVAVHLLGAHFQRRHVYAYYWHWFLVRLTDVGGHPERYSWQTRHLLMNLNCSILQKRPTWQPLLIRLPPRHPFYLTVISKLLRYWKRLSLLIKQVWTYLQDQSVKKAQILSYRAYYGRLRSTSMFTSN